MAFTRSQVIRVAAGSAVLAFAAARAAAARGCVGSVDDIVNVALGHIRKQRRRRRD